MYVIGDRTRWRGFGAGLAQNFGRQLYPFRCVHALQRLSACAMSVAVDAPLTAAPGRRLNSRHALAAEARSRAIANMTALPKLCAHCNHSIQLGCHDAKHGFFHRIFNCLMPMLALLPVLEEHNGTCVFGMAGNWGILEFVRPLLDDVLPPAQTWREIQCARCSGDPGICMAMLSERGIMEQRVFANSPLNFSNKHPTGGWDAQALLDRWIGRRPWPFGADLGMERRAVVLVSRASPPRKFVPGLVGAFVSALRNATGRDVHVYLGNETVAQTVRCSGVAGVLARSLPPSLPLSLPFSPYIGSGSHTLKTSRPASAHPVSPTHRHLGRRCRWRSLRTRAPSSATTAPGSPTQCSRRTARALSRRAPTVTSPAMACGGPTRSCACRGTRTSGGSCTAYRSPRCSAQTCARSSPSAALSPSLSLPPCLSLAPRAPSTQNPASCI